jgi:hypothetical protein
MKAKTLAALVVCLAVVPCGCQSPQPPSEPTPIPPLIGGLIVDPATARQEVGKTQRFVAQALPDFATTKATWTESDTAVATVSAEGVARCNGAGSAEITAESVGYKAKATLTCIAGPAEELINVSPGAVDVTIENRLNLLICTFILANIYHDALAIVFGTDHPALGTNVPTVHIPAGGRGSVQLYYMGGQTLPFSSVLRMSITTSDGTKREMQIPVKLAFQR